MKQHTDFNNSKYTRWYYELVQYRIEHPVSADQYRESHHIVPESFYINRKRSGAPGWLQGDPDSPDNLVWLTAREHALCHWLLTKMTPENEQAYGLMVYAFNMMWVGGEHQGREMSRMITRAYERNRIEWSRIHSETMKGREPWNKGLDMKNDPRCKGGKKNKGRVKTDSEKKQRIVTMKANGNDKRSAETRAKMSASQTGIPKPKSAEHRLTISKALTGKKKPSGHGDKVASAVVGNISINLNGVEKKVKQDSLQSWIDLGWQLGGRPRKKKVVE
jgi:hypothetical protein